MAKAKTIAARASAFREKPPRDCSIFRRVGERNSQLQREHLATIDLVQAFANFALKRAGILRSFVRIFAQHVGEQRAHGFRKSPYLFTQCVRRMRRAGQHETHGKAERIDFGSKIDGPLLQLFRAGKLRRSRKIGLVFQTESQAGHAEICQLHEWPTALDNLSRNNHQIRGLNGSMREPMKTGGA